MCGRYTYYPGEFHDLRIPFKIGDPFFQFKQQFNIAPTQDAPVIVPSKTGNVLKMVRWGLIPSWSKVAGTGHINARAETIAEKPTFKPLVVTRHCLVLANGFSEWRKDGKQKFPLHFKLKSGANFTFPGLWDTWRKPDGTTLSTFTLLTTTANELVRPVHDRMPVILDIDAALQWLACTPATAAHCLDL
jgi:putative SOS response-associated peptidase YedK